MDPALLAKKKERLNATVEANGKLTSEVNTLDAKLAELKATQESLTKQVCGKL